MKKSTRILAILMAFAMLLGSFSVMGSAYQAYKGDAIKNQYNDVDAVDFTLEQYASMGLDEVDSMLAKEKMVLDVFIGTLDLGSVNTTLDSVISLVGSVESLLPLLGDASSLPSYVVPLEGARRFEDSDIDVCYALLNFISSIAPLAEKYVNGTIDLGILDSFIADFKFNVRELAIGLIYGMTAAGKAEDFDALDGGELPAKYKDPDNGAITLLQELLNQLILGEWKQLDEEFTNPYSVVMYESYGFMSEYGESKYDTAKYDYYGWVHPNDWVTVGLGGCERVTNGATAPAPEYDVVDITTDRTGYEFIETLMQTAYNQILVPVLNRDTRKWVRELCGVTYDETFTRRTIYGDDPATPEVEDVWYNNPDYDPSYDGDLPSAEELAANPYAEFLSIDARAYTVKIPAGKTFVEEFNNTLGDFLDNVLAVKRGVVNAKGYSWNWIDGGNEYLFDNICSAGKFIMQASGNLFFSEYVDVPSAAEIAAMSNQEVVAFLMRAILNSSVDWMFIEDEYKSVAEVGYRAVEQLAWQDIPQFTYTKPEASDYATPEAYYDALVDKALDILFDVAVYNLNQGFDMVPASGNDPVKAEGLLQYGGDKGSYETNLIQVAAWGISEYGAILNIDFFCDDNDGAVTGNRTLTADHVWQDIDSIIDSLIPIKGANGSWISAEISGNGQEIVSKKLIFDYILKPIYYLDSTNLAEIFARNPQGQFATDNGVEIIMTLLTNVFELLFPGVFQPKATVDQVLNNELLGAMVGDLIKVLGTVDKTNALGQPLEARGPYILKVALPVVCMLLGLSDDQEFEEMEIYLDEAIPSTVADASAPVFQIYNGSSGINTAFTDKNGNFTQDKLYTYKITNIYVNTYDAAGNNTNALTPNVTTATLTGGESINVTLNGTRTEGNLVEVRVNYQIYGESGDLLTNATLSNTVYTYVGASNLDDDAIEVSQNIADKGTFEYYPTIYLGAGDDLDDIESFSIRIDDNDKGTAGTATVTNVANASTAYPFAAKNADAEETAVSMTGEGGVYFLYPFDVAAKDAEGNLYERFALNYEVDEDGNTIYDEETGEPIPDGTDNEGVVDGQYNVTSTINAHGSTYNITTMIHLYDDFGLESLFNRAIAANRQQSDYTGEFEGAWNNYVAALKEAARLVLKPKTGASFQSDIAIDESTGYANKYEKLATELEAAIEALEDYAANTGTAGLKSALAPFSGINYTIETDANGYPYRQEIEYDDPKYVYFGMRDFVPHTYNKYRDARDRAHDLIASQEYFVNAPFEEGYEPTEEDLAAYDESVAAYLENVENMGVIGSVEATYAIKMLELTGSRLIRLTGDTSKLEMLVEVYGDALDPNVSYTESSEERYTRAVDFAWEVLSEDDPRPSKINQATSELVAAWKKLAQSASYVVLDTAIANAKAIVNVVGTDADRQKTYTVDSYKAFLAAYDAALNAEKDLSDTEENNRYIAELAADLTAAQANLVTAGSSEAVFEFTTEDTGMFTDFGMYDSFIPEISMGALNHEYFFPTLEDGTEINGYLTGLGELIADEDHLMMAFGTLENVTYTTTMTSLDAYSTGSVIQLFNESTGDLLATYVVVVVGDINGDSIVDGNDVAPIYNNLYYKTDWEYDVFTQHYAVAADVSNDGSFDNGDALLINNVANGLGYVRQNVSPDFESSYVSLY
ncbi:MAG: hypothetical protein U0L11_08705 [Acutalibacteraceae bacterium]|nr:hypothetical protein [Acutalibacteraceae bacterium]